MWKTREIIERRYRIERVFTGGGMPEHAGRRGLFRRCGVPAPYLGLPRASRKSDDSFASGDTL